jgi:hypothetical protein
MKEKDFLNSLPLISLKAFFSLSLLRRGIKGEVKEAI